uniref:Uncharacterized protein n=1 Tax=Pyrodinium bahamense TaxID=73915 RepID=A0A7R9ZUP3_9DINO|mmetsp:Transcript_10439/g.29033  ORF Transcript_10439/g.29033 Transcript_10439/m.29033 type:complete len:295 (+) Transcript_10439:91-975(+)
MGPALSCCTSCPRCDQGKDNLLGILIRNAVMTFDQGLLGVDVHVGSMQAVAHLMEVTITDITLDNPPNFKSDYLLHVKHCRVNFDAMSIIRSMGKKAAVEEVTFQGVDFVYEPRLKGSNLTELKKNLQQDDKKFENKEKIELTVHKVCLTGCVARMFVHGFGPRLSIADIVYEDFNKEFGGATALMDIIRILLITVLKSALDTAQANVKGAGQAALTTAKTAGSLAVGGAKAAVDVAKGAALGAALKAAGSAKNLVGHCVDRGNEGRAGGEGHAGGAGLSGGEGPVGGSDKPAE